MKLFEHPDFEQAIIRAAEPNTFALEEQAVEITTAGPFSSSCACTQRPSEKLFCVAA